MKTNAAHAFFPEFVLAYVGQKNLILSMHTKFEFILSCMHEIVSLCLKYMHSLLFRKLCVM